MALRAESPSGAVVEGFVEGFTKEKSRLTGGCYYPPLVHNTEYFGSSAEEEKQRLARVRESVPFRREVVSTVVALLLRWNACSCGL